MTDHEKWMEFAFKEAEQAYKRKEVPIGSVIIHDNRIIDNHRLADCTMYVTLEPCAMCAGAIVLARIPTLVYGASDPKAGACGTLYNIVQDERLNHRVDLVRGVLEEKCEDILKDFFSKLRTNGIGKPRPN